jgi:hypothetical protein
VTCHEQFNTGMDLIQSTQNLQPLLVEQGVPCTDGNGLILAKYVAASSLRSFVNNSTALFNFLHTTGGTVVVVNRANNTADRKCLIGNRTFDGLGYGVQVERDVAEEIELTVRTNAISDVSLSTTSPGTTALNVLTTIIDPDNATAANRAIVYQNGSQLTGANAASTTPTVANATANFTVGMRPGGLSPFDGRIGSIIVYDLASLPTAERESLEDYVIDLHGIT